eukprot:663501-Amphidinium_carterae.1
MYQENIDALTKVYPDIIPVTSEALVWGVLSLTCKARACCLETLPEASNLQNLNVPVRFLRHRGDLSNLQRHGRWLLADLHRSGVAMLCHLQCMATSYLLCTLFPYPRLP